MYIVNDKSYWSEQRRMNDECIETNVKFPLNYFDMRIK